MGLMDLGEASDARKKSASTSAKLAGKENQGERYLQSMTKLPSGWVAGVGTLCGEVWGSV